MTVQCIDVHADLALQRGSCLVCITVDQASEEFIDGIRGVLAHPPANAPVLVCDCTSPNSSVLQSLRELDDHELLYAHLGEHSIDAVLNLAAPADVLMLRSQCVVQDGWYEGLRDAAYVDSRVATARAMIQQDTSDFASAAAAVRRRSLRLRPRVPAGGGPCVYVRRSALDLAGPFEGAPASDRITAGDFWHRSIRSGLSHVLADEVLVGQRDCTSMALNGDTGPLQRALHCARRARAGVSVVIDAGILSGPMTGTQVHVIETVAALARTRAVRLKALVPADLSEDVARNLESWPGVQLMTHAEARKLGSDRADVAHRPYQINNAGELTFLTQLADRLVVTHQDLISYFNQSYFSSLDAWERYRQLTRGALAIADRVLFVSDHARNDALAEELVEAHRASVVHNGVDRVAQRHEQPLRPSAVAALPEDAEVMLCIGTDYHHKNRIFALRVLEQLQQRHGWAGCLVFAGPSVPQGSSRPQETEMLADRPPLARSVITTAAISESEKAWLYGRARLVIYPTVQEGFGLVPFEAAAHDVPCLWAPGTSLSELLPDAAAPILPWDAEWSAHRAMELLRDDQLRRRNIESIREAGTELTWDVTARRLIELYNDTCDAPPTPASAPERRHGRISGALTEDSMRLIGPGGALPPDVERPLLALATHPRIGAPVFRALKLGYRTSYKLRRWRGRNGSAGPPRVQDAQSRK